MTEFDYKRQSNESFAPYCVEKVGLSERTKISRSEFFNRIGPIRDIPVPRPDFCVSRATFVAATGRAREPRQMTPRVVLGTSSFRGLIDDGTCRRLLNRGCHHIPRFCRTKMHGTRLASGMLAAAAR